MADPDADSIIPNRVFSSIYSLTSADCSSLSSSSRIDPSAEVVLLYPWVLADQLVLISVKLELEVLKGI
jgi:hypothetical protein